MSDAPVGKWVIVRSDRLMLSVDKADHVYHIGRNRQLPSPQLLAHKYVSREQLTVVWHPPHLYVAQAGKNPSFLAPECASVPRLPTEASTDGGAAPTTGETSAGQVWQRATLCFAASSTAKEAALRKGSTGGLAVDVPLSDPLTVTQAPDRHLVTASTIHFPEELGLPTLTVRFESAECTREDATAAATTRTAAEMLAVPTLGRTAATGNDDDDDEDELSDNGERLPRRSCGASGVGGGNTAEGEKPEWRGLLDVALQEQQRRDAAQVTKVEPQSAPAAPSTPSVAAATTTATTTATPATPHPLPSPEAPSASQPAAPPAHGAPAAAAAALPPSAPAPRHRTGFWEWKNHVDGKDDDPRTWRKYNRAVAELLEQAYQDKTVAKIKIPDSAMFDKPDAKGCTYGVCFNEKTLDGGMIQYSLDDPGRFRVIRRVGGSPVDRKKAKAARVIPSASDSESESEESYSGDESSSEESVSSSSSSSSSDSDSKPKRKKRRH